MMTQSTVATAVGVSQATLSSWEKGDGFPSEDKIQGLAGILGLDVTPLKAIYEASRLARRQVLFSPDSMRPNAISTFVKDALTEARTQIGDGLTIHLIGPEVLPFVEYEDIRKEWAENLKNDVPYHLVWFIDSLVFNQRPGSSNYKNRFKDIQAAMDDLAGMLADAHRAFTLNHYFIWSGMLDHEMHAEPLLMKEPDDTEGIPLRRVARFMSLLSQDRPGSNLKNKVMLVGADTGITDEKALTGWIASELNPLAGPNVDKKLLVRRICANISARYWNNRDVLVLFSDVEGWEEPIGYNIPRRGFRTFDDARTPGVAMAESVPRVLSKQEALRLKNLQKELLESH